MKKVYVVTSGEYSDYHIDCIFDSEEAARAYVAERYYKMNDIGYGDSERIEEYTLNSIETKESVKDGYFLEIDLKRFAYDNSLEVEEKENLRNFDFFGEVEKEIMKGKVFLPNGKKVSVKKESLFGGVKLPSEFYIQGLNKADVMKVFKDEATPWVIDYLAKQGVEYKDE